MQWWKERLQICRKPYTVQLVSRLVYSNLPGVDVNLKNGSSSQSFLEQFCCAKCVHAPNELVVPFKLKCNTPVICAAESSTNSGDLTRNGISACIVEEVQGPTEAQCRTSRFISVHAHPGSPYAYGLVGIDHDLEFPEPMPVIAQSLKFRWVLKLLLFIDGQ
ncbi:hypothetical protein NL676_021257 [Syzygium grande]|nr:hypothetical protein NL676_021257 [Syzygium grande]